MLLDFLDELLSENGFGYFYKDGSREILTEDLKGDADRDQIRSKTVLDSDDTL